jgi:hypothetical protein
MVCFAKVSFMHFPASYVGLIISSSLDKKMRDIVAVMEQKIKGGASSLPYSIVPRIEDNIYNRELWETF